MTALLSTQFGIMEINLTELSTNRIYHLITQTLVPRPIAWVLTESSEQNYNLAPFSYFSAVSSTPPLLMISVGKKPNGEDKDTTVNVLANKKLVIHISSDDQYKSVTKSAATLEHGVSELELTGLNTTEFDNFELPRLEDCKVAFGCRLFETQKLGDAPQTLIFAQVEVIYIDDDIIELDDKGRVKVDAKSLKPLARLGAAEYALFGDIISEARPK